MKINSGTDYSSIFSSLNKNDTLGINLSDYASIKSGSYGKLMKAYYGKNNSTAKSNKTLTDTQTKNYSEAIKSAGEFKNAVSSLSDTLKNSEDSDKIAKAVSDFADKYNSLMSAADKSDNSSIIKSAQNMISEVGANLSLLSKAGISLSSTSGKMSVDTEAVKENTTALKSLFGGVGSFGDTMASKAQTIENKAERAVNASKTYSPKASYDTDYVGTLYDSFN